jgi:hypothetical protein
VLTALVLICSTMVAPDFACTLKNASAVVRYRPSLEVQAACFMHAQVYLAGTSLGQELCSGDRVKFVCAPPRLPQPQRRVDDRAHSGRSALDWGNAARASRRFSSGVEMRRWSSRPLQRLCIAGVRDATTAQDREGVQLQLRYVKFAWSPRHAIALTFRLLKPVSETVTDELSDAVVAADVRDAKPRRCSFRASAAADRISVNSSIALCWRPPSIAASNHVDSTSHPHHQGIRRQKRH